MQRSAFLPGEAVFIRAALSVSPPSRAVVLRAQEGLPGGEHSTLGCLGQGDPPDLLQAG